MHITATTPSINVAQCIEGVTQHRPPELSTCKTIRVSAVVVVVMKVQRHTFAKRRWCSLVDVVMSSHKDLKSSLSDPQNATTHHDSDTLM